MHVVRQTSLYICVICLFTLSSSTLSPSNKKSKTKELKVKSGPQDESVFDKELIDEEPSSKDILIESNGYYKETNLRLFNSTILGYVTPVIQIVCYLLCN